MPRPPDYFYVLIDPNTLDVRYVGKSQAPERRLSQHYQDGANSAKQEWLGSLQEQEQEPILIVVGECDDWRRTLEIEKQLVQHLLAEGKPLLNVIYAGPNGKRIVYPETIAKIKESWRWRKRNKVIKLSREGNSWV